MTWPRGGAQCLQKKFSTKFHHVYEAWRLGACNTAMVTMATEMAKGLPAWLMKFNSR